MPKAVSQFYCNLLSFHMKCSHTSYFCNRTASFLDTAIKACWVRTDLDISTFR